jgi:hypothetical protein
LDQEVELKNWTHPADVVKIKEVNGDKEHTSQVYTDGSKNEHGVGSGVAIFVSNELKTQHKFKLDNMFQQASKTTSCRQGAGKNT